MEFFRNTNIDFLGKKWYFIGLSTILILGGIASLVYHKGPRYGIDFRGGTIVDVRFSQTPPVAAIRHALAQVGYPDSNVQQIGREGENEVIIGLEQKGSEEEALDVGKQVILQSLQKLFETPRGKRDLNNADPESVTEFLVARDPLGLASKGPQAAVEQYRKLAADITEFRTEQRGGLLFGFQELKEAGATEPVIRALESGFYLSSYAVRSVEIVGPKVGRDLRRQAILATLYALAGMLIYIALRFEWVFGVAAVLAVVHDVVITIGFFSLFGMEITLTVIAAMLALVGYSMNDTIVVFDRIRENLRSLRRENFREVVNKSINQTLSRTLITSGLTFITVLILYVLGGAVIRGFAFAMVVGILIGTYSSIAVASPILVSWYDWKSSREAAPIRLRAEAVPANRGKNLASSRRGRS